MIELELKNIKKYYGANLVLKDISFAITKGDITAIVGRNGSGKSTIFNVISREEGYDGGELLIRKDVKVGYLKQIHFFYDSTVKDVLNSAFIELLEIEKELRQLEEIMASGENLQHHLNKYSILQEKYEILGGYEKDTKLSKVCEGLDINSVMINKKFELLSGGEKTRVMLGKILIENPAVLLLDEPTNHLDMKSIEWLENYLKEYKGTAIIVSHDRYFLDKVVTKVVEIEDLNSKSYDGNYSNYIEIKKENLRLSVHKYTEQQKEINRIEESIKRLKIYSRNGQNEKFVKRAQSMEKRLDKIEKIDKPKINEKNINLNINEGTKSSKDLITLENSSKAFDNNFIFKDTSFTLRQGEKIALIGKNGCGKSTFVDVILGKQYLDKGELKVAENKTLGYLPQNIEFKDNKISLLDWFRGEDLIPDSEIRKYLAKFMFTSENVFKKIGSLSGGEKTRLVLSKMLYNDVNLLILDEPTNHLDISSIETLEKALIDFKGTIFFISHDRYFINKIASRVVELEDYKFNDYLGNYDYYKFKKEEIIKNIKEETENYETNLNTKKKTINKNTVNNDKLQSKSSLSKLEMDIEILEREIKEIDIKLSKLKDQYDEIDRLYQVREILNKDLELLLENWLNAQEA
ncbi:MAG: ribosomal protection-like ABC-F family protein [Fusobacteriaceae bacterium]